MAQTTCKRLQSNDSERRPHPRDAPPALLPRTAQDQGRLQQSCTHQSILHVSLQLTRPPIAAPTSEATPSERPERVYSADEVSRFWQHTITTAEESSEDFKHQSLPLARIKKVMKSDPEVQVSRESRG
jgi:hypothetical protein